MASALRERPNTPLRVSSKAKGRGSVAWGLSGATGGSHCADLPGRTNTPALERPNSCSDIATGPRGRGDPGPRGIAPGGAGRLPCPLPRMRTDPRASRHQMRGVIAPPRVPRPFRAAPTLRPPRPRPLLPRPLSREAPPLPRPRSCRDPIAVGAFTLTPPLLRPRPAPARPGRAPFRHDHAPSGPTPFPPPRLFLGLAHSCSRPV